MAIATIVDKSTRRSDGKTRYYLAYQFEVERSRFDFQRKTSRTNYNAKDVGHTVEVFYWPEDPKVLELRKGQTLQTAKSIQIIVLVAGLVALAAFWFLGMRTNRAVLARRKGISTTAKITRIVERHRKGRPTGKGVMEFRTQDGLIGKSLEREILELWDLGEGAEIAVFVRKGEVWWEGDVGPRESVPRSLPKVL